MLGGAVYWASTSPSRHAPDTRQWDWQLIPTPVHLTADDTEVRATLGAPTHPRASPDGPETYDVWLMRYPCGLDVIVCHRDPERDAWWIATSDAELDHKLHHLALPARSVWRADRDLDHASMLRPEPWVLRRYDDNGQHFEVRHFASRTAAECSMHTLEARKHHQTYVAEPAIG